MGIPGLFDWLEAGNGTKNAIEGGAALETHVKGKVVGIDASFYINHDFNQTHNWRGPSVTEESKRLHIVWLMFLRIKNYLTHGGAKLVVGVFDASRSNESKVRGGNVTKTGKIQRRNTAGLNTSVREIFGYLGMPTIRASEDVGEADTVLAQLQRLGLIDIIDSNDSDIFVCGGTSLLTNGNPGAKRGESQMVSWELGPHCSRAEVACCAVLSSSDTSEGIRCVGLKVAQRELHVFCQERLINAERCRQFIQSWARIPDKERHLFISAFDEYLKDIDRQKFSKLERATWGKMDLDRLRAALPNRKKKQFDKMLNELLCERFLRGLLLPVWHDGTKPFWKFLKKPRLVTEDKEQWRYVLKLDLDCKGVYGCAAKSCECGEIKVRASLFDGIDVIDRKNLLMSEDMPDAVYERHCVQQEVERRSICTSMLLKTHQIKFVRQFEFPLEGASLCFTCPSASRTILESQRKAFKYNAKVQSGGPNGTTTYLVCGKILDDGKFKGESYTKGVKYEAAMELLRIPKSYYIDVDSSGTSNLLPLPIIIEDEEFQVLMRRQMRVRTAEEAAAFADFRQSQIQKYCQERKRRDGNHSDDDAVGGPAIPMKRRQLSTSISDLMKSSGEQDSVPVGSLPGAEANTQRLSWHCNTCTLVNPISIFFCAACEEPRLRQSVPFKTLAKRCSAEPIDLSD